MKHDDHREVIPAVLYAECGEGQDDCQKWSLALVRTRWATEGQAIVEMTEGADGAIVLVEQGAWFIRTTDDGPALLKLDMPRADELDAGVLNQLLTELLKRGGAWGFEAVESVS